MRMKKFILFLLSLSTLAVAAEQPNVVLIYVDDLGYGDLSCYGATKVQAPNIDRLAKEGRSFLGGLYAIPLWTNDRGVSLSPGDKRILGPLGPYKRTNN